MKAAIAVILILWAGLSRVQAYGLNELLGIPLWNSESLWNDTAKDTAQRLDLEGTANGAGEFYRRSFYGQRNVLGVKLYAMDLYCNEGRVQRVVLGFLNQADLVNAVGYSNSKLVDLDKNLRQDEGTARTKLIQRLGQPVVEDTTEIWSWNGHLFRLRRDSQSLTLSIEKGQYSPTRATDGKIYEQDQKRTDLSSNVRRTSSGDVYIDDIPPISQGDRGFCVPAAWEKYLRYYGLSFNVYELADKGSTNIFGSLWMPFADRVSGKLTPYGYKVQYVAGRPWEFETLKTYVDQGMPLLWARTPSCLRNGSCATGHAPRNCPPHRATPALPQR